MNLSWSWPRAAKTILATLFIAMALLGMARAEIDSRRIGGDLASFLHSGASYREGLDPYADNPGIEPEPFGNALNLNPPILVYPFAALSDFDLLTVRNAFILISVLMMAFSFALCGAKQRPIAALALCATQGNFFMFWGQIYAPLILATCLAWRYLPRYESGVLVGLVIAIKPNFALWPAALFIAGHRRIAVAALLTAAAISAIPFLIDGPGIYKDWLAYSSEWNLIDHTANSASRRFTAALGIEPVGGWLLSIALATVVMSWAWRTRPNTRSVTALALPAVLLIGPATWNGYFFLLIPILLSRDWNRAIWAGTLLLMLPEARIHETFLEMAYPFGAGLIAFGVLQQYLKAEFASRSSPDGQANPAISSPPITVAAHGSREAVPADA